MKHSNNVIFSIIIPMYNSERYIFDSIDSAISQETKNKFLYEVIVVDDCSTDNSVDAAKTFLYRENYYITHTEKNSGPGIARNIGVDKSIGKYVLFLDSDDCLDSNILYKLYDTLVLNDFSPDLIAYNWKYLPNQKIRGKHSGGGRRGIDHLFPRKGDLINNYLSMKIDGSVIYTLVRKSVIETNNIKFFYGYHEDVDYIFKLYYYSNIIIYISDKVYYKRRHSLSITECITEKHVAGYIRAWKEIFDFICIKSKQQELLNERIISFRSGLTGVIANRVITIAKRNDNDSMVLFDSLYSLYVNNFVCNKNIYTKYIHPLPAVTYYDKVAVCFIRAMKSDDKNLARAEISKCLKL